MLTNRDLYERIDQIVDRAYLSLILSMIGTDVLSDDEKREVEQQGLVTGQRPLIELLYILLRNRPAEGYPAHSKLQHLLDSVTLANIPILNDAQLSTLETAQASFMEAIESTKNEIKKQFRQKVIDLNRQHRQHVAVRRIESASAVAEKKNELRAELIGMIPMVLLLAQEAFERSFSSALTDTINDVAVDAATADSLFTGVPPKDVIVYKKVINDDSLCQWCEKFYKNPDGSPVLFTLAQLQANGSNYGKPKSEWKPTLGKTHPRCRCQLFHRRPKSS